MMNEGPQAWPYYIGYMGRGLQRLATVFQSPLIGQPDFTAVANSALFQLFFICLKFYPTGQNNSLELKNPEKLNPLKLISNRC